MIKRALLVGLNEYPDPRNELHGCVNDITDMALLLTKTFGFDMDDVRLLQDDHATKAGIVDRLGWLTTGLSPGDFAVFQYSGHGTQIAPRAPQGDVVALHDCICPYDFDFSPEHALQDTDFFAIFGPIPQGVHFVWMSDSCHSGDLTRGFVAPANPGTLPSKSRSFYTPADTEWRIATAISKGIEPPSIVGVADKLNVQFLGACTSQQTASDAQFGIRANGAFTYFLIQALNAAAGRAGSVSDLIANLDPQLSSGYGQDPQLRGADALKNLPFLSAAPAATQPAG